MDNEMKDEATKRIIDLRDALLDRGIFETPGYFGRPRRLGIPYFQSVLRTQKMAQ